MSQLINIFKKQGGGSLLKKYWKNGLLGYAIVQFLLTGRSVKALEFLRLGITLKMYQKFTKKFLPILKDFDKKYQQASCVPSKKVWIYWSTGLEETAPDIVKLCYSRIQELLKDREVILLSKFNYTQYVELPDYIVEKYNKGIIAHVHFADLLRIELLAKYGGTWIDSTVYLMSEKLPSYMLDSELFMFQKLKPGADGNAVKISSWFISAYSNHKIIHAQRHLMREYWRQYDNTIDYFFFHHLMSIVADYYTDEWKKIIQVPNSAPHILLLMLYEKFDQKKWDAVRQLCPIQKLTYKLDEEKCKDKGTFYDVVMNQEIK